jgi:hypothetical protein
MSIDTTYLQAEAQAIFDDLYLDGITPENAAVLVRAKDNPYISFLFQESLVNAGVMTDQEFYDRYNQGGRTNG